MVTTLGQNFRTLHLKVLIGLLLISTELAFKNFFYSVFMLRIFLGLTSVVHVFNISSGLCHHAIFETRTDQPMLFKRSTKNEHLLCISNRFQVMQALKTFFSVF